MEQFALIGPPSLDIENRRQVITDVGGPVAALNDLPIEPARASSIVQVDVARVGVAVDHTRDLVIGRSPNRFEQVWGISELWSDIDTAPVVEERLEEIRWNKIRHLV